MQHASTLARLLSAALLSAAAATSYAADVADPAAQTQQATDDAAVLTQAAAALQQDKDLQGLPLTVSSAGEGVIVVAGAAPSAELADRAVKLLQAVPGVKEVRSEIKVG